MPMELTFVPGAGIRLPAEPDWGEGHVQSCVDHRLVVNFENRGKVTLDTRKAKVELVRAAPL